MSSVSPVRAVAQNNGVHPATSHRSSPNPQNVTAMCNTSPARRGVSNAPTTFYCKSGKPARCFRAVGRTKRLTAPRSAQTWASWRVVTREARGKSAGGVLFGHGACPSWNCSVRSIHVVVEGQIGIHFEHRRKSRKHLCELTRRE